MRHTNHWRWTGSPDQHLTDIWCSLLVIFFTAVREESVSRRVRAAEPSRENFYGTNVGEWHFFQRFFHDNKPTMIEGEVEILDEDTVPELHTCTNAIPFTTATNKSKQTSVRYNKFNKLWTSFQQQHPITTINIYIASYFQFLDQEGKEKQLWQYHSALSDWM